MALAEQRDERYIKQLGKMQRPIPGQSLTNDPTNPLPFEGPPEFTKKKEALEEIFTNMIREEVYVPMMDALMQGTPIVEMTEVILFEGFRQGKWNPDLFVILIEPTMYMIMALAERADIDYRIDRDVDEEEGPTPEIDKKFDALKKSIRPGKVKAGVLPQEITQQIEQMEAPASLMAKPEKPKYNPDSLLSRGQ